MGVPFAGNEAVNRNVIRAHDIWLTRCSNFDAYWLNWAFRPVAIAGTTSLPACHVVKSLHPFEDRALIDFIYGTGSSDEMQRLDLKGGTKVIVPVMDVAVTYPRDSSIIAPSFVLEHLGLTNTKSYLYCPQKYTRMLDRSQLRWILFCSEMCTQNDLILWLSCLGKLATFVHC